KDLGKRLLEANGQMLDLSGWLAAADLTASRAAFALVNDFEAAARLVSIEPPEVSPLTAKDRLRELLLYSVSEDYFAVRKRLGGEGARAESGLAASGGPWGRGAWRGGLRQPAHTPTVGSQRSGLGQGGQAGGALPQPAANISTQRIRLMASRGGRAGGTSSR